ncbi:TM1802 family CRISPR-associated protein [Picrophilus oshimae]|uniref:CRISPR-associated protein Csh1 n=1 Tax=Picrophilus torridus (strain ATCC 700027 / DSM 9790 / JCM 10055 / NBRC 100828 / KAW 2/3) TaxID=1122961 RepID=A0A8G2FXL7_PICTO|nr:TM1802 family CRISPR-associated protein [Picrophilus oshimae]SMD31397.1 CRISPR-associated protein Csh1 [Picrophilus oshimae DSM 9789]
MISALEGLGGLLTSDALSNKIQKIDLKKNGSYLCIINFFTSKNIITLKFNEITDDSAELVAKEYLWIGNIKGNKPQWHLTTDNIYYAFNSIPNFYNYLKSKNYRGSLINKIESIINKYYKDNSTYFDIIIYPGEIKFTRIKIIYNKKEKNNSTQYKNNVLLELIPYPYIYYSIDDLIKYTGELNGYLKNISLFTIGIDDEIIAKNDEYKDILKSSMTPENENYEDGTCSVCGQSNKKVTADTSKFRFKYYNTNKISFSSKLLKDFSKNFVICSDCYQKIINAENYLLNNLSTNLGDWSILIIPEETVFHGKIEPEKVFKITDSIINSKAESLAKLEILTDDGYIIDIMFYEMARSFFKVIDIITEIPESRVLNMINNINSTYLEFKNMFSFFNYNLNINGFYKTLAKNRQYKEALTFIISLFKLKNIKLNKLLSIYMDSISQYYYENGRLDTNYIIALNAYLKFLAKMNVINEFKFENLYNGGKSKMKEDNFIREMGYSKEQECLFWIGYAIKKIGSIQYANGIKSNPMLEKINYQGMNLNSLEKLLIQIDEKIKQYGIYSKDFGYALFMAHSILSKYISDKNKWPIDDVSNVFLIMTGYSVADKLEDENNEDEEDDNNE